MQVYRRNLKGISTNSTRERIYQDQICYGDLINNVLIDQGDQTDDPMCLVTRLEVKIEIRSPLWSRP